MEKCIDNYDLDGNIQKHKLNFRTFKEMKIILCPDARL